MELMRLKKIILAGFFVFLIASACSSTGENTAGGGDEEVGTIVNNPKPPSSVVDNPFPDFDAYIITIENLVASGSGSEGAKKQETATQEESGGSTSQPWDMVRRFWNYMLMGKNIEAISRVDALEQLGEEIAAQINNASLEFTESWQSISTSSAYLVLGTTEVIWEVQFKREGDHDYYQGINSETGQPQWRYVRKSDQEMGGLVYVDLNGSLRFGALAFNFTDASIAQLVLVTDNFYPNKGFVAARTNLQCNVSECIGEYLAAFSNLSHFRYSYNDAQVCLGVFANNFSPIDSPTIDSPTTITHTFQFTVPGTGGEEVDLDVCAVEDSLWSTLLANDLPNETTALIYYNNWELFTSDVATNLLAGGGL